MARYIAFLRAINITGRFVKMADLRHLFESLGYADVATYSQSGNILFDAPDQEVIDLERMIEERLRQALGYEVAAFVRSDAELIEIARYRPFSHAELIDGSVLYIAFLRDEPSNERQGRLLSCANDVDHLDVYGRHVFWLWRRQLGDTTLSHAKIEKMLGMPATVRNATTVRKITAKYLVDG